MSHLPRGARRACWFVLLVGVDVLGGRSPSSFSLPRVLFVLIGFQRFLLVSRLERLCHVRARYPFLYQIRPTTYVSNR